MSWRQCYGLAVLMGVLLFPLGLALSPPGHLHWGIGYLGGFLILLGSLKLFQSRGRRAAWAWRRGCSARPVPAEGCWRCAEV